MNSIDAGKLPILDDALVWVWLVDMERTCSLLIGRCLGGMLLGSSPSQEELLTEPILTQPLFSNGLCASIQDIGQYFNILIFFPEILLRSLFVWIKHAWNS